MRVARCSRGFLCVCTLLLRSLVQIFIFQFLSMSLFLNLLFETDSYSNEYLLAKFGFDTAENEPCEFRKFELSEILNLNLEISKLLFAAQLLIQCAISFGVGIIGDGWQPQKKSSHSVNGTEWCRVATTRPAEQPAAHSSASSRARYSKLRTCI